MTVYIKATCNTCQHSGFVSW